MFLRCLIIFYLVSQLKVCNVSIPLGSLGTRKLGSFSDGALLASCPLVFFFPKKLTE